MPTSKRIAVLGKQEPRELKLAEILKTRPVKDAFDLLVRSGVSAGYLEDALCRGFPVSLCDADKPKPPYFFGPAAQYNARERRQKARAARELAKWAARIPVPNISRFAPTFKDFAAEVLKRPPKIISISPEDYGIVHFLKSVHDCAGQYHYPQVAVLLDGVLVAMVNKHWLNGSARMDQGDEAHLRKLMQRRRRDFLPRIAREDARRAKSATP